MSKKVFGYVCLAASAICTVWVIGALATVVENNLTYHRSALRLAGSNIPLLIFVLIGIAILMWLGRFLLGKGVWLKMYGGFLAGMGLFIGFVQIAVPLSIRIDIRAFLSVQANTTWLAIAFFAIGGLIFVATKKRGDGSSKSQG